MNNQQIFDKVKNHLLTQLAPAYKSSYEGTPSGCKYRMEDGKSCAVGCLIPDNLYDKAMEGRSINDAFDTIGISFLKNEDTYRGSKLLVDALKSVGVTKRNLSLLGRLQRLHDGNYSASKKEAKIIYENGLKEIAKDFRLKYGN